MDFMSNQPTDSADEAIARPEVGLTVLPFYFLCDEGGSMAGASMDTVNEGIKQILKALFEDPVVDGKARVSIIAFSDTASVVLPLTQLTNVLAVPGCTARGSSSYSAAFRKLREQIDIDVPDLKAQGFHVLRPVVFFMSDGEPNQEPWEIDYKLLIDPTNQYRPLIISFGVEGANPDTIKQIATAFPGVGGKFACVAEFGTSTGPAIIEMIRHCHHSFNSDCIEAEDSSRYPVVQLPDGGVEIRGRSHRPSIDWRQ
jgi:uncharacterized protein YegL